LQPDPDPKSTYIDPNTALRLSHDCSKMLLLAEHLTRHIFFRSTQGEDTSNMCICSHVIGAGIVRVLLESKKSDVIHTYLLGTACCARYLAAATARYADGWGEGRPEELEMGRSWGRYL